MRKYIVTLAEDEREALGALTYRGRHKSQKIINSLLYNRKPRPLGVVRVHRLRQLNNHGS